MSVSEREYSDLQVSRKPRTSIPIEEAPTRNHPLKFWEWRRSSRGNAEREMGGEQSPWSSC